jgi:hypothetical protein
VNFFKEQRDIIQSVYEDDETFIVAGNQLGKDFTAAAIALWFFLCHHPVRIVATSVKDDHLRVLFGEIENFITTAAYQLTARKRRDEMVGFSLVSGGPLMVNHRDIRKFVDKKMCKISYLRGMVAERGAALQGHHAEYTMALVDEASAIDDVNYEMLRTWAKRILVFGNPLPPRGGANFFKKAVKEGSILRRELV